MDTFLLDRKTVRAVELNVIIVGEASKGIPSEIREAFPLIPWSLMRGMRNRLMHGYHAVDEVLMWKTVQNDLPPLKQQLVALLQSGG